MFEIENNISLLTNPLVQIGEFLKNFTWIIENPYESFKLALFGTCSFIRLVSIVYCAASLLIAILGYKKGIRYIPISISIYVIIRILASVL